MGFKPEEVKAAPRATVAIGVKPVGVRSGSSALGVAGKQVASSNPASSKPAPGRAAPKTINHDIPADIDPDTYAIMKAIEDEESQRLAEQLQNEIYSGNEDAIRSAMGGRHEPEEPRYNQEVYYDQMIGGRSEPMPRAAARAQPPRAGPSRPA